MNPLKSIFTKYIIKTDTNNVNNKLKTKETEQNSSITLKNDNLDIKTYKGNFDAVLPEPEIKGAGQKVKDDDLKGLASAGNGFHKFTDAESVAKNLKYSTAIVYKDGVYYLYTISPENAKKIVKGDNSSLDSRIVGLVQHSKTFYNTMSSGKIMINNKEFKISGINVYDLADVAARDQKELEKTLKLIAETGCNTVRFWAFSIHKPEDFAKILDTSQNLGLNLKFIPVLGNQWQDCESGNSHFTKNADWYKNGYKKEYLPHVIETVKAMKDKPGILMWELMNEPEAEHNTLRNFADEVSLDIHKLYDNTSSPHPLISLGTLGGKNTQGMVGNEYKDLFGLPNIDVVTAHDYTYNSGEATEKNISPVFRSYIDDARELHKPFFLGEIGVKVRKDGVENAPNAQVLRDPVTAMDIMQKRLELYQKADTSGFLLWGPEPLGHAVDGSGHGFSFSSGDIRQSKLKDVFGIYQK